jgi:uncharacterized membrane protein
MFSFEKQNNSTQVKILITYSLPCLALCCVVLLMQHDPGNEKVGKVMKLETGLQPGA